MSGFGGHDVYPDVWTKAVALGEGIARNHALLDGNKRTAFLAIITFLDVNGVPLGDCRPEYEDDFMVTLATGGFEDVSKAAEVLRQILG